MTFLKKNMSVWMVALLATALIGFYGCTEEDCGALDCGPNGSCNSTLGVCECDEGYVGVQCETYVPCLEDESLCGENSVCDPSQGGCVCVDGWFGENCDSQNPCVELGCGENQVCAVDTAGVASCVCDEGWFGENCDSNDPCEGIECIDNAECIDGICDCIAGFEGDDCTTMWTTKMLGSWTQTDECDSGTYVSDVIISSTGVANQLQISNFGGLQDSPPVVVIITMTGANNWSMESQFVDGFDIAGTTLGSYNAAGDNLAISYTVNGDACVAVFTR